MKRFLISLCMALLLPAVIFPAFSSEAPVSAPVSQTDAPKSGPGSAPGRYVWIPDTLKHEVDLLLDGRHKMVHMHDTIDLSERVLFRGDTIPMVMKSRNFGRFERGLYNYLFIPKGQWHFGLTASYGEFSTDDLEILDVLSDFDFSGHTFSIRPEVAYFIRNNLSVGLRLSYNSSKATLSSLNMDISDDMSFNLSDIMYRNESYTAAVVLRQYIGLARRGRFGIFNEVALGFSSGNGDFTRPYDGNLKNTHTTYMKAALDFSPGVCVMIMKNVSFNLSFGIFGFYLQNANQSVDGVSEGNRFTSGANFRFNIFNLNFGLGVHI